MGVTFLSAPIEKPADKVPWNGVDKRGESQSANGVPRGQRNVISVYQPKSSRSGTLTILCRVLDASRSWE